MKTSETFQLIEESLKASYTYPEYVKLIEDLLADGKSTARNKTRITEYSKLTRMKLKKP